MRFFTKKYKQVLAGLLAVACILTMAPLQPASAAIQFIWPSDTRKVGSPFNDNRGDHYHAGVDIYCELNSPIYAAAAGTVEAVYTGCTNDDGYDTAAGGVNCKARGLCNPNYGYTSKGFCNHGMGNCVIIKHDDGRTWTCYGHLLTIAPGLKKGSRVSQRQIIGHSGNTGQSKGYHLHFEVRLGSGSGEDYWRFSPVNPLNFVHPDDGIPPDTTAPNIGWIDTDSSNWGSGKYLTIGVSAYDDRDLDRIELLVWTERDGIAKAKLYTAKSTGGYVEIRVPAADFDRYEGYYYYMANAIDAAGNQSDASSLRKIELNSTGPVIEDVQVYDVSENGYYVRCRVSDPQGVNRVQFPTWTVAGGQDDLLKDWSTNSALSGNMWWDGYAEFFVSTDSHRREGGSYITHIYAYDNMGNSSVAIVPTVEVPWRVYREGAGDTDGNGSVDASDALMALKSTVRLSELTEDQAYRADIDENGVVDALDALMILKVTVRLIVLS